MGMSDDVTGESHTRVIFARYADRQNIGINRTPPDILIRRYLSKVADPEIFRGKTILEIGAGCSQYIPVFMQYDCRRYYANDLIPERLEVVRSSDLRYVEIHGDFRTIALPEPVDIVFASLTMMFVMPMLDDFVRKIALTLKPGGIFVSMDANYLCPLSVYRLIRERRNNPSRLFSPFRYADKFRSHGFDIETLVPFTGPWPWVTGNWLLGTTFWLKARKL